MPVIGIDIGLKGAIAIIDESGELVAVHDMPCLNDGPARRLSINAPLLAAIVAEGAACRAYVELVGPRPGEGSTSAFAFGRCRGVVEGVLAAAHVPVRLVAPPTWKRCVGIAPGKAGAKDAARSEACRRWPAKAALFARAKDDGRAEAALIGIAGLSRERQERREMEKENGS